MRLSTLPFASLMAVCALGVASPAAAAQTAAEDIAAARALGVQGIRLADEGKCNEALEKLDRAEALYHAPTILGRLGECQVELGQIVRGTENLNRVVREQLPPNPPPAFVAAQERAKKVLERALPRIAYLVVRIEPATVAPQVAVDASAVPAALIGVERPTDPGTHEVVASAPGYHEARATVTLAEGAHQEVALVLTADPAQAPAAAPVATPSPVPAPTPASTAEPRHGNRTGAFVALAIGGAGLVTGTVTGILAVSKKGSLDCPDDRCPPSEHDTLDSARTFATVSTIGFGVGVVGVAVGTVLLLTTGKTNEVGASASIAGVHAKPWFGERSLGLEGSF